FNRIDLALDLYKEAIRLKANSAETYMLLGNAHYLNNEIEQAIASYRASINIAPENDEYRLVYTQVLDEYIDKKRSGANV
ncbi:MAG: tetratricopeptide repeat protein, partial [Candidatus Gastranaerophilaceae bacterium]